MWRHFDRAAPPAKTGATAPGGGEGACAREAGAGRGSAVPSLVVRCAAGWLAQEGRCEKEEGKKYSRAGGESLGERRTCPFFVF